MIPLVKPYIPEREVLMPELEKILYHYLNLIQFMQII